MFGAAGFRVALLSLMLTGADRGRAVVMVLTHGSYSCVGDAGVGEKCAWGSGRLLPLSCVLSSKGKMQFGAKCLAGVPSGAMVRLMDGSVVAGVRKLNRGVVCETGEGSTQSPMLLTGVPREPGMEMAAIWPAEMDIRMHEVPLPVSAEEMAALRAKTPGGIRDLRLTRVVEYDLDGDGTPERLYSVVGDKRGAVILVAPSARPEQMSVFPRGHRSGALVQQELLGIADIDHDGRAELIVSEMNCNSRMFFLFAYGNPVPLYSVGCVSC